MKGDLSSNTFMAGRDRDEKSFVRLCICRLTQESLALAELQSELQAVRRQNVDLEKQLGRQQLDLTMKTGVLFHDEASAVLTFYVNIYLTCQHFLKAFHSGTKYYV